ncbi:MAG: hypothetical protein IRZ13_16700, partial [Acetobacteraceae bacterium]|nr:hypothetical protein [Acetobacteraceae bacterium]
MSDTFRPDHARGGAIDVLLARTLGAMRPGWVVLQDCTLDGDDAVPPARLGRVLIHPDVGIALLDLMPGPAVPRAGERLRAMFDAVGFVGMFGGYPPVVHVRGPPRELPALGRLLDRAFAAQPGLALTGGAAWVETVQRVLGAGSALQLTGLEETAVAAPSSSLIAPQDQELHWVGPRRSPPPADRPATPGVRALAVFWAAVALVVIGGTVTLAYLGPPPEGLADGERATPAAPRLPALHEHPLRPGPGAMLASAELAADPGEGAPPPRPLPLLPPALATLAPIPPASVPELPEAAAAPQSEALALAAPDAARTAGPEEWIVAPAAAPADVLPLPPATSDDAAASPPTVAAEPSPAPEP